MRSSAGFQRANMVTSFTEKGRKGGQTAPTFALPCLITRDNQMTRFAQLATKREIIIICIGVSALVAEFILLEGTFGVSLPSDRDSAVSSLEIKTKGTELHFITRNRRFTVVDFWTNDPHSKPLVLRELFFMDRADGAEGPPDATITVEAMSGKDVRWAFREPGERGDIVTNNLYMVTCFGNGESGNTYTYFSLANGRKVRTNRYVELSRDELEALDLPVTK